MRWSAPARHNRCGTINPTIALGPVTAVIVPVKTVPDESANGQTLGINSSALCPTVAIGQHVSDSCPDQDPNEYGHSHKRQQTEAVDPDLLKPGFESQAQDES